MLFNSFEYIVLFLPIAIVGYFFLNSKRLVVLGKVWLVLCSFFFYSWWKVSYLPIILISILVNYGIGYSFKGDLPANRKVLTDKSLLIGGILFNLGLLGYFKYAGFVVENVNAITASNYRIMNIALPLAISFFTFQQIAYLVDSYKKQTKEYDFLSYCLFVSFFPQLIAGPIVHHAEMMPQFNQNRNKILNFRNLSIGLFICSTGLFKKVILADTFAIYANEGYSNIAGLSILGAWITSLCYTFQLYFDFAGYTDMAIGSAYMFNIKLPFNFNQPYKARNIQEFWARWHITLSRFLRSYLYIPLGGNRKGEIRTYVNLVLVFLLSGLWHGAGWTFILWGFLHGLATAINRFWKTLKIEMPYWVAWFITFNFVNLTWVFFRAERMQDGVGLLKKMFGIGPEITWGVADYVDRFLDFIRFNSVEYFVLAIVLLSLPFVFPIFVKDAEQLCKRFKLSLRYALITAFFAIAAIVNFEKISEFIYFNF